MNYSEHEIWLRQFDEDNVRAIVLSLREDEGLVGALRRQPGWSADFEGDGAVVFVRSTQTGKVQWTL